MSNDTNDRWGPHPQGAMRDRISKILNNMQMNNGTFRKIYMKDAEKVPNAEMMWGLITARVVIRIDKQATLATIAARPFNNVRPSGSVILTIGLNEEAFMALSYNASVQLIITCFMKIICGKLTGLGMDLEKQYSRIVAEMSMLMYINKTTKFDELRNDGVAMPVPDDFGLADGLSWLEYAKALGTLASSGQLPGSLPLDSIVDEEQYTVDKAMQTLIDEMAERDSEGGRGLVPGDVIDHLKAMYTPPQMDWKDALHFRETGNGRHFNLPTKKRAPRRGLWGFYDGMKWTGQCNIAIIEDVSGSRGKKQIAMLRPEIQAMINRGSRVFTIQFDAAYQDSREVFGDEDEVELFGRGGTTLQPAIDDLDQICEKHHIDGIDMVIMCTDGHCDELNFGDYSAIVLLDSDGAPLSSFEGRVSGSDVEIFVMKIPSDEDDPNTEAFGN